MSYDEAVSILALKEGYTKEDVKKAYRKLSKQYHPDIVGSSGTETFIKIKKAYELLSDSRKMVRQKVVTHESLFKVKIKT